MNFGKKVLVTGGAGYVGSILVPLLLQRQYQVTIFDKFMYGSQSIFGFIEDPKMSIITGDVCNPSEVCEVVKGQDWIIHLAAIVGFPACDKDPLMAKAINIDGTRNVAAALNMEQRLLFPSTGSVYGKVEGICTEETPVNPLTLYGESKWRAEEAIRGTSKSSVIFRFATVFGAAPRFRMDLLINDFAYQAVHNRQLAIFEGGSRRTFLHVYDAAMAFIFAMDHYDQMQGMVFNVGDDQMNYTKIEVAQEIKKHVDFYLHEAPFGTDPDQRDYAVSYNKLKDLGYEIKVRLDAGVAGVVKAVQPITHQRYW